MAEETKPVVADGTDTGDSEVASSSFTPPAGYEGLQSLPSDICLGGIVSKGFQRGSKLLGIPTANIPLENPDNPEQIKVVEKLDAGIYFGWTQIWRKKVPVADDDLEEEENFEGKVFKTVVSIGWNPYFKNKTKTIEPYVMHEFHQDFYDYYIRVVLCGYLRPELDFTSMEDLISAINQDIKLSKELLDREEYAKAKSSDYFVHL
jgi:riboflavin kinase